MWEKAQKEKEQKKMAAMLEIKLRKPLISQSDLQFELMRRGF